MPEKKNFPISQDSNNIFSPKSEDEVSEIVENLFKNKTPVEIIGLGSKKFIGNKLQCSKILDLSNLSGIIEYFPEELYIKVKACTPIIEIEKKLNENNQQLAFETLDFGYIVSGKSNKGTAAGSVSCNFAGSRRFKVGSVRDYVLGFRGVNGKGDIIKSGGTVVKNVTGYDLSKLITGSFGTLVALTEITFKVLPKKPLNKTIIIHEILKKDIAQLFNKIINSSSDVSGSMYLPLDSNNKSDEIFKFNDIKYSAPYIAIRADGSEKSIEERINNLSFELELNNNKTSILDYNQSDLFWKKVNNLELFSNTKNSIFRVVIPQSKCASLLEHFDKNYRYFIDWCGSLVWLEVSGLTEEKFFSLRKSIVELGGYLTVIKQQDNGLYIKENFTVNETVLNISKKIKESFDPKKIFNPGKMYKEI
ncbi:MAG: FAD-binding protein [Pelagibacteraceae bacterium]|nr:FAD-binding protein [Pelagibacteraceae bacterium]